jgi:hypothetical protein
MYGCLPVPSVGVASSGELVLRAAMSAHLGRYRGQTRPHTESDLRVYLRWCTDHELDPLAAVRLDIERYVRSLQDVRCYQPSTVSRRLSVVVGFYRVCVIDEMLPYSPADYAHAVDRARCHAAPCASGAVASTPALRQPGQPRRRHPVRLSHDQRRPRRTHCDRRR